MFIKLGNLNIHYKIAGSGDPLLLIHGWGSKAEHLTNLQQHLAKRFTVYSIDLPGFGLSNMPEKVWSSTEYADLIAQFINDIGIVNPVLIGHSLGGKIIINLVSRNLVKVKKIVLISSAGIRLRHSFKVYLKIRFFKTIKFFAQLPILSHFFATRLEHYRRKFGSEDYQNANGLMRLILVKLVNEDLAELLSLIKVPTLLLWGDQDKSTPLQAGKLMQKMIFGSKLKVFSGSGHFPFLDNYEKLIAELDSFLV